MSYEPNTTKELLGKKSDSSYSENIKKKINLISFNKGEKYDIVGSASYRVQKYYGDIDIVEKYVGKDIDEVIKKFIRKLKSIIKSINTAELIYFSDFS